MRTGDQESEAARAGRSAVETAEIAADYEAMGDMSAAAAAAASAASRLKTAAENADTMEQKKVLREAAAEMSKLAESPEALEKSPGQSIELTFDQLPAQLQDFIATGVAAIAGEDPETGKALQDYVDGTDSRTPQEVLQALELMLLRGIEVLPIPENMKISMERSEGEKLRRRVEERKGKRS